MIALPDNVARIFSMRELMGLSTAEICAETGIKQNNCWVILHRAGKRRAETLTRSPEDEPS